MSKSTSVAIALVACLCGLFTIAADEQADKSVKPLRLNVDKNGRILVLNQRLTVEQLKPVLTQIVKAIPEDRRPPVELNVHPDSRHEHVVGLTELCKSLKLTKITLRVTKGSSQRVVTDRLVSKQTLKEAIEQVESLDGDVHEDDGVVVQIGFHKKKIGDAELKVIPVFRGLISLSLTGTRITDAGLIHIKEMPELGDLGLHETAVTDVGLLTLSSLKKLSILGLSGTNVTDNGMAHLAAHRNMAMLFLGRTRVTNAGLKHLTGMSRLYHLGLSDTKLSDAGLIHVASLKGLKDLRLDGTSVTDAGLKYLKHLPKLNTLMIQRVQITGSGFGDLPVSLKTIWMQQSPVNDDGLRKLSHLKHLESLNLAGTKVTDAGLVHLTGMASLQKLTLPATTTTAGRAKLHTALPNCTINLR